MPHALVIGLQPIVYLIPEHLPRLLRIMVCRVPSSITALLCLTPCGEVDDPERKQPNARDTTITRKQSEKMDASLERATLELSLVGNRQQATGTENREQRTENKDKTTNSMTKSRKSSLITSQIEKSKN